MIRAIRCFRVIRVSLLQFPALRRTSRCLHRADFARRHDDRVTEQRTASSEIAEIVVVIRFFTMLVHVNAGQFCFDTDTQGHDRSQRRKDRDRSNRRERNRRDHTRS